MSVRRNIFFILRVAIGIIFIVAGVGKILDLQSFSITVEEFRILPQPFVLPFSVIVPIVEVISGLAFVWGVSLNLASLGLVSLLVAFLMAIGINLLEGNEVSCGCAGVLATDEVGLGLFFKDVGLLLSVLSVWLYYFRSTSIDGPVVAFKQNPWRAATLFTVSSIVAFVFFKSSDVENPRSVTSETSVPSQRTSQANTLIQYGSRSPFFQFKDMRSNVITGPLKGKITLLIFVPQVEAHDRNLAAVLQHCTILDEIHGRNGLQVYGIFNAGTEAVAAYTKAFHLTFPMVADSGGAASALFGVAKGFLTTIIIDRKGIIRHSSMGILAPHLLEQLVEKELFGMPSYSNQRSMHKAIKEGDSFPNITIEDVLTGEQKALNSMVHSYAVIGYFSSNCGCASERKGILLLNAIRNDLRESGVILPVLGIFGTKYSSEQIKHFRESGHITFSAYASTEILRFAYSATPNIDPLIVLLDQTYEVKMVIGIHEQASNSVSKVLSLVKGKVGA